MVILLYEVDGPLRTPDGRTPRVWTVWQLNHGEVAARLVTAWNSPADHVAALARAIAAL